MPPKDFNLKDWTVFTTVNPPSLRLETGECPVILVAVPGSNENNIEWTKLAETILGPQKWDLAFFNVPNDSQILKQLIDQILTTTDPQLSEKDEPQSTVSVKKVNCKPIFTNREIEILQLIAAEYTNEEIAEKLCLAKRTVDNHRVNLMQRVNAKNTAGLIGYAFRNGLVA